MIDYNFDKRYSGKSGTATTKKQDYLPKNESKLVYENVFDLDKYPRIKTERKVIKYVQVESD